MDWQCGGGGEWRLGRGDTAGSEQSGYSRTAIYQHAERVVQAVASEQASGISYEDLWAENERLKAENEALWQAWSEAEDLSESKQRELASAGSAMGLSLTQIVILLAIVLPAVWCPAGPRWGAGCSKALSNRVASWRSSIGLASAGCWCCVWTKSFFIASPF